MSIKRFPIADYQKLERLEDEPGGIGVVYRAECLRDGRIVALKCVAVTSEIEAEQRGAALHQEFWRKYPDLVPTIYEHGFDEEGNYYIAMELIEGRSLQSLLRNGPLQFEDALSYGLALADFLAKLHRFEPTTGISVPNRKVHADLKPAHVRIVSGRIKVLDFGISRRVYGIDAYTRGVLANGLYSSPEQLEGRVDPSVDLWALGVILYEMSSGRHPFADAISSDSENLSSTTLREHRPPSLPPWCGAGLRAVVAKMLAPDIEARYVSAAAVIEELNRILNGQMTLAERDLATTATRRTKNGDEHPPTQPIHNATAMPVDQSARTPRGGDGTRPERKLLGRSLIVIAALLLLMAGGAEAMVWWRVDAFRDHISGLELLGLLSSRDEFDRLAVGSPMGLAVYARARPLFRDRLLELGGRAAKNYRDNRLQVSSLDWKASKDALTLAEELGAGGAALAARIKNVEGHLHRFEALAFPALASQHYDAATRSFRESTRLDDDSPDPFLGLVALSVATSNDPEEIRGYIEQAAERHFSPGEREQVQLARAYSARAERRLRQLRPVWTDDGYLDRVGDIVADARQCVAALPTQTMSADGRRVVKSCQTLLARLDSVRD